VRSRLLGLTMATTAMVVLAFLVPLGFLLRTSALDRVAYDAEVTARALAPTVAATEDVDGLAAAIAVSSEGNAIRMTVVLPDRTTVGVPIPFDDEVAAALEGAATSIREGGVIRVLVPVVRADGALAVIQVAVDVGPLGPGVAGAWAILVALGVALIGVSSLVVDRLGRSTVRAVRDLEDVAVRLGRGELEARSDVDDPPEIAAVARALGELAERIGRLLVAERETVADLSHRLRTPLTALRLDIEALPPSDLATRLSADAAQRAHAGDQVIRQARRQGEPAASPPRSDLGAVTRRRVGFWQVLAEDQQRSLTGRIPDGSFPIEVAEEELEAALDALLGNAITHTPEGTEIRVIVLQETRRTCLLVVEDDGPGLSPGAGRRGTSQAGSTGLGLDIVR
jgi:signal transduction histidine kinase